MSFDVVGWQIAGYRMVEHSTQLVKAVRRYLTLAGSRSVAALGENLISALNPTLGPGAVAIYLLAGNQPELVYSHEAPEGLLKEYDRVGSTNDPMLDHVLGTGVPIDNIAMQHQPDWLVGGNDEFLQKWGFGHCMAGPILLDRRVVAVVYIARKKDAGAYARVELELLEEACFSASLALEVMSAQELLDRKDREKIMDARTRKEPAKAPRAVVLLPPRAAQVVELLCGGLTNKEIARELNISAYTVKDHVSALCQRFEVSNRTELVHKFMLSEAYGH
ncbi:LuxR C-terminal-related transcriptional regulator [Boseaceae bacterium BT-24-1]|nr:LuxR C-terminal-related transcriptional regulator [Boseaceae bacterium BT-24-1]